MTQLQLNPHLLKVPLYVAGKSIEEVQEELGLDEIVKLGSNEHPLGPSPRAVEAAAAMLSESHRYPNYLEKVLRRKLAAATDPVLTEKNFLIGNGGCDLLRMIFHGFMGEGGQTLTASVTFPMFSILTTMFGGTTVTVPLTADQRLDLPAILRAITPATRVVVLCTPNNPTGDVLRQRETDEFMAAVPEHVLVVFDEAYCEFITDEDHADPIKYIQQGKNVIAARSFSKSTGLANLRVGYAIGPAELIEYLHHAQIPFNTGSIALAAAAASLDDEEYRARGRAYIRAGREFFYAALDELDLAYLPSQANFILIQNLPLDARALADAMLRRGVIVRWAGTMGVPNGIRITLGTQEENQACLVALRAVLEEAKAAA